MNDPEILKRLLEEAKREVEGWPDSMKSQEPARLLSADDAYEDEQEDQPFARCG